MKNILYVLIFLILIPINGCAMSISRSVYAPNIEFNNLSDKRIQNLDANWSGHRLAADNCIQAKEKLRY
jgi:hypothetical protein